MVHARYRSLSERSSRHFLGVTAGAVDRGYNFERHRHCFGTAQHANAIPSQDR